MEHPLSGIRLKLARAQQHLEALDQDVSRFLARDPYGVESELNEEGEVFRARVREEPPDEWGIAIGECVHNIRTALDHLAWQLCIRHAGHGLARTEFPIFRDPSVYSRVSRGKPTRGSGLEKIRGVEPDAQAIIERLQPYHAGENVERHPLWVLQELSNINKHQVLHFTGAVLADTTYSLTGSITGQFRDEILFGPFEHGAEIARFWFSSALNPDVRVHAKFGLHVAFADGPAHGAVVVPTLRDIIGFVRLRAVGHLERFFD
jgi:hypothetical protein